MASRMKSLYDQVIFERRVLLGCTCLVGLSVCIWAIAIGTDHWFLVSAPNQITGLPLNPGDNKGRVLLYRHQGLWGACTHGQENGTAFEDCKRQVLFPKNSDALRNPRPEKKMLVYIKTQVSFAVISIFLMLMGFGFSIYTFRNPRYMFKRLAGGIHFITAACVMVVIQVVQSAIEYEKLNVFETFPKGAVKKYDYSMVLAWLVFLANLIAGCAFMLFSRKRKRDKAPTEEIAMADEPTIIGR
ncbi:uncharacterized protein LOC124405351 [Diprion similis]|uniref:uncharacterized protein LOC124405351 n=1 Tax=Diprion similis TaxID=362088 RepID=UPI001EF775B7|nr:uncharacterized protein LOC124405351 [Diprion similis]XP_046736133.1 uncharacterized protein LOC124405351 [Diprion similis]